MELTRSDRREEAHMDALELVVDEGRPASASRFFQLGADLLSLLDELSDVPVAWRVDDLRMGSAVARVAPPVDEPEEGRWLHVAVDALDGVQAGGPLPDDWSPDAVKVAHRFVMDGQGHDETEEWGSAPTGSRW